MDLLKSLETATSPRVHANGFLQLDITSDVRLHVWGDERIPKQPVSTPIHDHAFSFTSRILIGALRNRTYCIPAGAHVPTHQPHRARPSGGENTVLVPYSEPVYVALDRSEVMTAGEVEDSVYSMEAGDFHESDALSSAVTVIYKRTQNQIAQRGIVLVPLGRQPSNDFDRHFALSSSGMWSIIAETVRHDPEAVGAGITWALLSRGVGKL